MKYDRVKNGDGEHFQCLTKEIKELYKERFFKRKKGPKENKQNGSR